MKNLQKGSSSCGAIYGLGLIGAAVYFISKSATFTAGAVGFLKALVWPAYLVYYGLKFLGL
jgi:hypothetical protein